MDLAECPYNNYYSYYRAFTKHLAICCYMSVIT
jgi:hypothetical protein